VDEQTFIDGSREAWDRLATAIGHDGAASGRVPLARDAETLRRVHEDYRRTAADLAYAQTHYSGSRTEAYLNDLTGRAHARLYGSAPRTLRGAWEFFSRGYPRLVRSRWREVMVSALLLFGASALGYLLVYVNYPLARLFLPAALRDGIGDRIAQGGSVSEMAGALAPLLSAGITANNVQVALVAFAGGITFGALTTYALIANGLLIGVLAGLFVRGGEGLYFWSLIVPHGALEIPAIVLAAGAGLVMARALISPGDLPRGAALRSVSSDAVKLVLGTIPLFLIAGAIEGFFTPTDIDPGLKLAFGGLAAVLLGMYLLLPGRGSATDDRVL
jgi:uncharacterized membrane protein SpoIIM required for sporulation